jgi:hypothetical protein
MQQTHNPTSFSPSAEESVRLIDWDFLLPPPPARFFRREGWKQREVAHAAKKARVEAGVPSGGRAATCSLTLLLCGKSTVQLMTPSTVPVNNLT